MTKTNNPHDIRHTLPPLLFLLLHTINPSCLTDFLHQFIMPAPVTVPCQVSTRSCTKPVRAVGSCCETAFSNVVQDRSDVGKVSRDPFSLYRPGDCELTLDDLMIYIVVPSELCTRHIQRFGLKLTAVDSAWSSISAVVKEAVHITVSLLLPFLLHVQGTDRISAGHGTRCRPGSILRVR